MGRQSTNGYAEAVTNGNPNGDHPKLEAPFTSFKNAGSQSTIGCRTLAIPQSQDDPQVWKKYRPFILDEEPENDWINDLELDAVMNMAERDLQETRQRLKVLVLYGSLRRRSVPRALTLQTSTLKIDWIVSTVPTLLVAGRTPGLSLLKHPVFYGDSVVTSVSMIPTGSLSKMTCSIRTRRYRSSES